MHGIILSTIRDFAVEEYGREAWAEVQSRADVEAEMYVPVDEYPDEHVYELARAAGEVTGLGARGFLVDYGRYVVEPLVETYGVHLDDDWDGVDLIENVPTFHAALRTHSFANYTTPEIQSTRVDADTVHLSYDSPRQLCDVARGAIAGVGDYFDTDLDCRETHCVFEDDDVCRFEVHRLGEA
jgi:predicted hydrocarbon binding protein